MLREERRELQNQLKRWSIVGNRTGGRLKGCCHRVGHQQSLLYFLFDRRQFSGTGDFVLFWFSLFLMVTNNFGAEHVETTG